MNSLTRRRIIKAGLASAALQAVPAFAQKWPTRPVRIIVPFAAAGATDLAARAVAQALSERLGQSFVVENRPGAGAMLGTEYVAKAPADGFTLLFGSSDGLSIGPQMKRSLPYDPVTAFTPIAMVAYVPIVYIVNAAFPAKTLGELLTAAKARPGAIRYGSAGVGSILHMAGALLEVRTGTQLTHVPYRGGAPMLADLAAGQIEFGMATAELALRFAGKVRAIAQASPTRHPLLPDVPTTAEAGVADTLVVSNFGMVGPAGLPEPVVSQLSAELAALAESRPFQQKMIDVGGVATYESPQQFSRRIADENRKWKAVIAQANIARIE
ncbi:MAG: Bug family tripartite tricarboxylate transporter substrate binding protein [Ramlibacter sp.]